MAGGSRGTFFFLFTFFPQCFLNIVTFAIGRKPLFLDEKEDEEVNLKEEEFLSFPELQCWAVLGLRRLLPVSLFLGHCHIFCEDVIWGHVAHHL